MATLQELSTVQLRQALQIREQIETLQQRFDALFGGSSSTAITRKPGGAVAKKRSMSPEGRAKIAAAQKARWAVKKGAPARATEPVAKRKRVLSEEGRARIVAATKARWAAKKGAAAAA